MGRRFYVFSALSGRKTARQSAGRQKNPHANRSMVGIIRAGTNVAV